MKKQKRYSLCDLTEKQAELFLDIAEGRRTHFYLLDKGWKIVAFRLQAKGLIETGERDRHVPMCLTADGKREAQRYLAAR